MEASTNFIPVWNTNQYTISTDILGKGSFGIVYKGRDNVNQKDVAIKSIQITRESQYRVIFRELFILDCNRSRYLLQLLNVQKCMNEAGDITHILFVLPLVDYDLKKMIHNEETRMFFTFSGIIKILYQILKGLQYLYKAGVIHRDLKPTNIGINRNNEIKILGFGMARYEGADMTRNVQSVYYRAIEVFHSREYTIAIDMWSAGCIFSELLTRKVLFKGRNEFQQVQTILSITGLPLDNPYEDFERDYRSRVSTENKLRNHIMKDIIDVDCHVAETRSNREGAENIMNLICSMLELNPINRCTPTDALNCQLFQQYRDLVVGYPDDDATVDIFEYDYDKDTDEMFKKKTIDAINNFVPSEDASECRPVSVK